MTPVLLVAVAIGGLLGAPSRYLVDRFGSGRITSERPWGTVVVNLPGSFLLGLLNGLSLGKNLPATASALFGDGFCGAYTTFSTFSYETIRLLEDGDVLEAATNVGVSVVVGLAAAAGGVALGLLW